MAKTPGPTVFVLFGATGDLARRMVLPAFYTLAIEGLLPDEWVLIGNGRGDVSHENFRGHVREALEEFGPEPSKGPWKEFASRLRFAGGGFNSDDPGSLLDVIESERRKDSQLVHYLAIPPVAFEETTKALGEHGLAAGSRVVFEKPFGTSPESFRKLNRLVHRVLDEEQVYRIDHFLGKEATQNLHVLRFANALVGDAWSRATVEQVQIDVPEPLDIDDRARFYDETGATLDMVVTHLFQVAAEIAMEPPASLSSGDLLAAREAVLEHFRPLDAGEVVLGQYDGYRDVDGVADDSTTDTFIAARLWVDSDRWRGVPFLLRTGKRMAVSEQRVTLVLKPPAQAVVADPPPTALGLSLKGTGELSIEVVTKRPGPGVALDTGTATLPLSRGDGPDLPAYATLIRDVLDGDRSLFTSSTGLAAAWAAMTPLLENRPAVQPYAPGSWGPDAAAALAEPVGWHLQNAAADTP
jgi:glucose-6-phosphate 1-dehydrogenase